MSLSLLNSQIVCSIYVIYSNKKNFFFIFYYVYLFILNIIGQIPNYKIIVTLTSYITKYNHIL